MLRLLRALLSKGRGPGGAGAIHLMGLASPCPHHLPGARTAPALVPVQCHTETPGWVAALDSPRWEHRVPGWPAPWGSTGTCLVASDFILCPSGCPLKQLLSLLPHCWQVACSPGGHGVTASLPGTGKVLSPVFGPVTAAGFGPGEVVVGAGQCPASPGRGVFCPLRPGGFGWLLYSSQCGLGSP